MIDSAGPYVPFASVMTSPGSAFATAVASVAWFVTGTARGAGGSEGTAAVRPVIIFVTLVPSGSTACSSRSYQVSGSRSKTLPANCAAGGFTITYAGCTR